MRRVGAAGVVVVAGVLGCGSSAAPPAAETGMTGGVTGSGTGGMAAGAGGSGGAAPGQGSRACTTNGTTRPLRVYVAGESIEERNRFVDSPFTCEGKLNERGGADRNDNEEYGWMVPLAERVWLRAPGLTVEFVGAGTWSGADDAAYSGSYPSATPGRTSAIAGTDISAWLDEGSRDRNIPGRRQELVGKTHCYDVALAARGGNDLNQEVSDSDYKARLKELVRLLLDGSSCRAEPLVVVTAHMPDRAEVPGQDRVFQRLSKEAVEELKADTTLAAGKRARIQHVDVYGAFKTNRPTTSMPSPHFWTGSGFDLAVIGREGDTLHPRRLASIYAGEVVADALDLTGY